MKDVGKQLIRQMINVDSAISRLENVYRDIWHNFISLPTVIKYDDIDDVNDYVLLTNDNKVAKIVENVSCRMEGYYDDICTYIITIDDKDYIYFENGYPDFKYKNKKLPRIIECKVKPQVNINKIPVHIHVYDPKVKVEEYKRLFSSDLEFGIHYLIPDGIDVQEFKYYVYDDILWAYAYNKIPNIAGLKTPPFKSSINGYVEPEVQEFARKCGINNLKINGAEEIKDIYLWGVQFIDEHGIPNDILDSQTKWINPLLYQ